MVANTRTPRTGEQICNGQLNPAWTSRLQADLGASEEFLAIGRTNLAAEIDANSLRVRIAELDIVIDIAERHGDTKTAESYVVRKSNLIGQLDAMIKGGTPAAPVPQVEPGRVTPVTIRRAITEDFQILHAIKLVRSYADDRIGLKEAKDLIEAVNAATPDWPIGLPPLRVRRVDDFIREMGAIGYQVKAVEAEDASSTYSVYDVRIRWEERTGARDSMEEALIKFTDMGSIDVATYDSIHDGGPGGAGAEFRQLRISDYNTFCRKMKEYGYAVELLVAPADSPQEDNPFTVRPPV